MVVKFDCALVLVKYSVHHAKIESTLRKKVRCLRAFRHVNLVLQLVVGGQHGAHVLLRFRDIPAGRTEAFRASRRQIHACQHLRNVKNGQQLLKFFLHQNETEKTYTVVHHPAGRASGGTAVRPRGLEAMTSFICRLQTCQQGTVSRRPPRGCYGRGLFTGLSLGQRDVLVAVLLVVRRLSSPEASYSAAVAAVAARTRTGLAQVHRIPLLR